MSTLTAPTFRPSATGSTPAPKYLAGVLAFARRDFRDAISSRWFLLYTLALSVMAVGVSFLSLSGVGSHGFAGFGRTAAGLLNLIMLIVPLMALTAGAGAIAGERERGTLVYLMAQPVSRTQIILGKYMGLALALVCSLAIGFGISAIVLAWRTGSVGSADYLLLVCFSALLALAMLALGLLISVLSRRSSVATGLALFVWLTLVFLSDLGLMASSIIFKLRVQEIFAVATLNPLQSFKMGVIVNLNATLDVLGPVGAYASITLGGALPWVLGASLVLWMLVPLALATLLFARSKA